MRRASLLSSTFAIALGLLACDAPPSSSAPAASAEPAPRPPSSAAVSLLGGLGVGDRLGDWEVAELGMLDDPNMPGAVAITLRRGEERASVWVAKKGQSQFHPPKQTKAFDVFYGPNGVDEAALRSAVAEVMARVEANEAHTPEGGML